MVEAHRVGGANPPRVTSVAVCKWLKQAGCKPVAVWLVGSNPTRFTNISAGVVRTAFPGRAFALQVMQTGKAARL